MTRLSCGGVGTHGCPCLGLGANCKCALGGCSVTTGDRHNGLKFGNKLAMNFGVFSNGHHQRGEGTDVTVGGTHLRHRRIRRTLQTSVDGL